MQIIYPFLHLDPSIDIVLRTDPFGIDETIVIEDTWEKKTTRGGIQWHRGKADKEGFFTLQNLETSKYLTADNDVTFKMEGTYNFRK